MTIHKSFNKSLSSFIDTHQNKILVSLFVSLGMVSIVFTSLVGLVSLQNAPSKQSQASGVYQCATGETLSGTNCLSTPTTYPIYAEACDNGYTAMDSVCVTFIQRACTDYVEGTIDTADSTLCKFNNIDNVRLNEVTDHDGRACKGVGFNFKYYNVVATGTITNGPIVCSNIVSGVTGKTNFRFIPRTITSIRNFVTTQTGTSTPICATGYTLSGSQCSIAAKVTSCSVAGEFLDATTSTCKPCPVDKYCLNSTTGETSLSICPNGGILSNNLCVTSNKVATVGYVDGCNSTYVRYDKTCAIEEIRTHDKGCSYFYASDNINVTATQDTTLPATALNICSTGGRTDFADSSITRVSDLECDGIGTGWYNYNVAYDPLVCGNTYDVNNKAAFRFSEKTFTKIVGLQKIGSSTTICPSGWLAVAGTDNCSQPPIIQRYALVNSCPTGSFAPAGSDQLSDCITPCPSSSSSSSRSSSSSSSSSAACLSSSVSTPQGGGVIIISNQSSSSSTSTLASSSSQTSSIITKECVLNANQYRENNICISCPSETYITTANPVSIKDCVPIITISKPTVRTGGLEVVIYSTQVLITIIFGCICAMISNRYYKLQLQVSDKSK